MRDLWSWLRDFVRGVKLAWRGAGMQMRLDRYDRNHLNAWAEHQEQMRTRWRAR